MAQSFTTDELQALAAYPFKDTNWKNKFLVGSLIILLSYIIPIIPLLAIYGYCAQIMRRIIVEDGEPFLPEWDNLGKLFGDGLRLFGAGLAYSLPIILLFLIGYGLLFSTIFVTPFLAATTDVGEEAAPVIFGLLPLIGALGWMVFFGLAMVATLILGAILPAMLGHVIASDEFGAAFRWREWWAIFKANLSGFLIAYVILLGTWFGFSFVLQILYFTIIGCCLFPFILPPVTLYTMIVASPLFARAYRAGVQRLV